MTIEKVKQAIRAWVHTLKVIMGGTEGVISFLKGMIEELEGSDV